MAEAAVEQIDEEPVEGWMGGTEVVERRPGDGPHLDGIHGPGCGKPRLVGQQRLLADEVVLADDGHGNDVAHLGGALDDEVTTVHHEGCIAGVAFVEQHVATTQPTAAHRREEVVLILGGQLGQQVVEHGGDPTNGPSVFAKRAAGDWAGGRHYRDRVMSDEPFDRHRAKALDAADPLSLLRDEFELPRRSDGRPQAYFAGNSLGAIPRAARDAIDRVVENWSTKAVAGHFEGDEPWYRYDEPIAARQAGLVGARVDEVALMGTLTVDLHLLMASFYRPEGARRKILIEPHAFPSDRYAVASQVVWHGGDPVADVLEIDTAHPDAVTPDDVARTLAAHDGEIAMALIGGVNYYTGQFLDLGPIAKVLRDADITVGYDLAHAAGNVPMALHDWDVDFAAWCTYKYLNSGPGSTGGYFVHQRHSLDLSTPRLAGWWGNDPTLRFDMHAEETFVPMLGAGGWKISNPSVLAMAPVGASLEIFDRVGIEALRERSVRLTAFLEQGLRGVKNATIITPADPERRGCQLSVRVGVDVGELEAELARRGTVVDARDPDIIRIAPTPMYNSFEDIVDVVDELVDIFGPAESSDSG